jgi:hypothetical protein
VFEPKVLLLDEPLSDLDDGRFNVDVSAFAGYAIGGQVSVIVPARSRLGGSKGSGERDGGARLIEGGETSVHRPLT